MIKKLLLSLFLFIIFFPALIPFNQKASADSSWACKVEVVDQAGSKAPSTQSRALKMVIHTGGQAKSGSFMVTMRDTGAFYNSYFPIISQTTTDDKGDITVNFFDVNGRPTDPNNPDLPNFSASNYELHVYDSGTFDHVGFGFNPGQGHCASLNFQIIKSDTQGTNLCVINIDDETYAQAHPDAPPESQNFDPTQYFLPGNNIGANVDICPPGQEKSPICEKGSTDSKIFQVVVKNKDGSVAKGLDPKNAADLKNLDLGNFVGGSYLLDIKVPLSNFVPFADILSLNPITQSQAQQIQNNYECSKTFTIDSSGGHTSCISDKDCSDSQFGKYCLPDKTGSLSCQNSNNGLAINPCVTKGNDYVCQTAIGAIGTSASGFAQGVLQLFLGLAGLILLFTIILNGYKFMTSQGDPEKVKEARESITAAIAGLLVIIFAIVILQLITVDLLHLPGFKP